MRASSRSKRTFALDEDKSLNLRKEAYDIADAIVVTRARAAEIFPPQLELEAAPKPDIGEDLLF